MSRPPDHTVAFAPASVGNVAVGFDVLGYSAPFAGDRVRAVRTASRGVRIAAVTGVVTALPLEFERNTAGMAAAAMAESLGLDFGLELTIEKGIASIPVSVFYEHAPELRLLRFCFAKDDATLTRAAEILCRL